MLSRFLRPLRGMLAALVGAAALVAPAIAEDRPPGRLVSVEWLQQHRADVVLLDASLTHHHLAGHIPGAVSADLYRYGVSEPTPAAMEQRIRSWGLSPGRKVVVYDKGGDMMAPRLFYDLYYHGAQAADLFILDGGLAQWRAQGGGGVAAAVPSGWNAPMLRAFDAAQINIVEVRPAAAYALGHVPFALSIPADTFRRHIREEPP